MFHIFHKTYHPEKLQPKKITDGAASQYKNRKNLANFCFHDDDFGISAKYFLVTLHGKGAFVGLGCTIKRLAARASLQRPYNNQIMTARQLFDWACRNLPSIHFGYCNLQDYEREQQNLEQRFSLARTLPGTRKLQSFIPIQNGILKVRPYSASESFKEEKVVMGRNYIQPESIIGFVTSASDGCWWLACVLQVNQDDFSVRLTFLHPHGPNTSFRYPAFDSAYQRYTVG